MYVAPNGPQPYALGKTLAIASSPVKVGREGVGPEHFGSEH